MPKPGPSEWGKMSEGQTFGLLACDFGRALFSVGWGRYELMLLGYLIENSWGVVRSKRGRDEWPDPVAVRPNFHALSVRWKVPCQRLYEGRDALKSKGVVMESEEGLWINKDADRWVDPKTGAPLLPPAILSYATDARTRRPATDKQASYTPEREPISDAPSRPSVNPFHATACNGFTPQREVVSRHSVKPHIEERARELDSLDSLDKAEQSPAGDDADRLPETPTRVLRPTPDGPPDPAMRPAYPDGGALDIGAGPHSLSDSDARQIHDRIWDAWGNARLCREFFSRQRLHSAATWNRAIQELVEKGTVPGSVRLIDIRAGEIEVRAPKAASPSHTNGHPVAPAPRLPSPDPGAVAEYKARVAAAKGGRN